MVDKMKPEKIKVSFRLGEGEGNPLEFTFQGKSYTLYNGTEVKLPIEVVDHLNSLKYPIYEWVQDEATGQIKSKLTGYKHRFFCIPLDTRRMAEQQAEVATVTERAEKAQ